MNRFLPEDRRVRSAIYAALGVAAVLIVTQFVLPGASGGGRGTPMAIVFKGVCAGMVAALPACGMVLLFRTLRIINFMQTALGISGAILVFEFIQYTPIPFPVAFLLGIATATLYGVVVGVVLLRFFNSSRLTLTVMTILGAQLLGQLSGQVRSLPFFPPASQRTTNERALAQNVRRLLPFEGWEFRVGKLPLEFGFAHVFALEMAIVTLAGLAFFLRYTRQGVAVRALSENAERASLLGIGTGKLSLVIWGIAGALSGVGVVLFGVVTTPGTATGFNLVLVLTVLAAAVIGRFESIPITILASVLLGISSQAWEFSFRNNTETFRVVLFVVISGALLLQRRGGRSETGEVTTWAATDEPRPIPKELSNVPPVRWGRLALIAVGVTVVLVFPFVANTGRIVLGGVIAIEAVVVCSLVVLTGWTGQVSLGQYAFVTIGAVVGGSLTSRAGVPFWFAVPLVIVITGAIAALVGVPALRIRGLLLLVATFAFAIAVHGTIFNREYFDWLLPDAVERPTLFFLNFEDERSMYFLSVAALVLTIAVITNLRRSRVGRLLIAVRENEANVQSFGVSVIRMKLLAFAISGGIAGLAGILLAHQGRAVTQATFDPIRNGEVFIAAVFGGVSSVGGALLGSAFFQLTNDFITSALWREVAQGTLPLLLIFAAPGGLISLVNMGRDSILRVIAQRRQIVVPSLFADYDPTLLERQLIPLGEVLDSAGLAALPTDERFVLDSVLYQGSGERVVDSLGPKREAADTAAIGAAARSVEELEVVS